MSVCRFCLAIKARKDIRDLKATRIQDKTYSEIMLFCLGIQFEEDSDVSSKLCLKCFRKTIDFFEFKTLALKNEAYFRTIKDTRIESKDEIAKPEIKTEIESVNINHDVNDNGVESETCFNETEIEIKNEPKEEGSEDEVLSVIKRIKYEYIEEIEKVSATVKKGRGRPKKIKPIKIKVRESKTDMKVGPMKVCEECGKYVRDLKSHRNTHVPLEQRKRSKCEICDKVFASAQSKWKHKKRRHFNTKKECPVCNAMVFHLNIHMKLHNPDDMKYECAPCGRRFVTKSRLEQHLTIHTKDKPFECDVCNARFRLKLSMTMHKRQVHDKEKSHLCQYCSKSFFKKHHLHIHLRSHTKEKPYSCSTCGKNFSSRTVLKNHMLIHTDDKKYACSLCDMSFVRMGYLNAHMVSHTKEKRYPCQYCGVRFHRSDHRKRHEFTAHLKHATSSTATPT